MVANLNLAVLFCLASACGAYHRSPWIVPRGGRRVPVRAVRAPAIACIEQELVGSRAPGREAVVEPVEVAIEPVGVLKSSSAATASPEEELAATLAAVSALLVWLLWHLFHSDLVGAGALGSMPLSEQLSTLETVRWLPWLPAAGPDGANSAELLFAVVMAASAFAQALTGFGFAIVAVGCLSGSLLHTDMYDVITPCAATLGALVGAVLLLPNARRLEWSEILPLLVPCTLLTPVGSWVATLVEPEDVNFALGSVILAFVGFLLSGAKPPRALASTPAAIAFGALAGVLGGAYDVQGPPLVVCGQAKGWEAQQFVAVVLSIVAINSAQVVVLSELQGKLDSFYYSYFCLTSLPGVLVGIGAGKWASERINPQQFKKVLLVLCSGLAAKLLLGD